MSFTNWVHLREMNTSIPNERSTQSASFNAPTVAAHGSGGLTRSAHSNQQMERAIQQLVQTRDSLAKLTNDVMGCGYFDKFPQFKNMFLKRMQDSVDNVGRAHALIVHDENRV